MYRGGGRGQGCVLSDAHWRGEEYGLSGMETSDVYVLVYIYV